MGDGLKILKDKRHRSSSSLAGAAVEGTRSERKLEIRASIPEVDDQFAAAEARCDELQDKIDLVKSIKKKRKLKKRSMTTVNPGPEQDNIPFITVRTLPKKKVSQASRLRAFQVPANPIRGYVDPATVEQRRMLGQYHEMYRRSPENVTAKVPQNRNRDHRTKQHKKVRPDGDSEFGASAKISSEGPLEVACGRDDIDFSDMFGPLSEDFSAPYEQDEVRIKPVSPPTHRRHVPRDVPAKEYMKLKPESTLLKQGARPPLSPRSNRRQTKPPAENCSVPRQGEVVELFKKNRGNLSARRASPPLATTNGDDRNAPNRKPKVMKVEENGDDVTGPLEHDIPMESKKECHSQPRRVKYRSRRYEMPTIASQMKQAGTRCYYGNSNKTNIPFIVSKSTTPSHNIGVNLQQVLNGIKTQQPLTGIPMTIAYHMGMGHMPTYGPKNASTRPTLENREINTIKVGQRLLRLPSFKYISYDRLLNLYREGDGIVSRFLRANSRPHYFYTSMYNLVTNREDFDGATSKGRGGSQEAKQSLAEYASLYREYEQIDSCIKKGNYDAELERRRDELSKELTAREDHIRKVVQDYRTSCDIERSTLRASVSTAEDGYRHSTFKLNFSEPQQ